MMSANESIAATKRKRQNRTVTLHLGNTLAEYQDMISTEEGVREVIRRVEVADSLNWGCLAGGHEEDCLRRLRFTHHDGYRRWAKHFDGTRSLVSILRVRCLDCGAVFTVHPSFIVRYKRYDTDAIEKFATLLFITEDSYRMAGVSQALGIDKRREGTWVALEETAQASISATVLWDLIQWLGQLSPAQLNLALNVAPPTHVIEDEKHTKECGAKTYVPIVYAPKEALIWWIDYIDSVSETALSVPLWMDGTRPTKLCKLLFQTSPWQNVIFTLCSSWDNILLPTNANAKKPVGLSLNKRKPTSARLSRMS
jgi:hypothetical protein